MNPPPFAASPTDSQIQSAHDAEPSVIRRPSSVARSQSSVLSTQSSTDRSIALLLALLLFGVYLLSFNGTITSSDGLSMFAVTESAIKRGDLTTDQWWGFFRPKAVLLPGGEVYSKYGYGTSLFAAPLYALALAVPFLGLMQTTLLSSALATCATAFLLYLASRRLNFSPLTGVLVVLLFGLATPAWVYAKEFWSESFAALTLFAAFYFLLCYRASFQTRDAIIAGIWLGLAITVRTTNVLLVPFYLVYAFISLTSTQTAENMSLRGAVLSGVQQSRRIATTQSRPLSIQIHWRAVIAFLVPLALSLASVLLYNLVRYGNPLTTGYRTDETFDNNILLGAYGLLFSPGKGLFVYAPILVALPFGIWQFYRRHKRELYLSLSIFFVTLLLFSAWYYWSGGTNWAARFLVPTLPFLLLLCAPLIALLLEARTGLAFYVLRFTYLLLIVLSILNELAGISVNSLTYRLRVVNLLSGSALDPDWNAIFAPALSPLIGYWQTLKPTNFDNAWLRAAADIIQVDWLVIALASAFILFTLWLLIRLLRGRTVSRALVAVTFIAAIALTLFSLARSADDPAIGLNAGYLALLHTLAANAQPNDVMLLNDDAQARFFFNHNRSPIKWYGLSRNPASWETNLQPLVSRVAAEHPRLWFAYDNNVDAPNPMRDWLAENLTQADRFDFENGVTLILYQP